MSIMDEVRNVLISKGIDIPEDAGIKPCPYRVSNNCTGCKYSNNCGLLVTIGINILGASIKKDPNFDILNEIDRQLALYNAGIEPIIDEV